MNAVTQSIEEYVHEQMISKRTPMLIATEL
jgi:hypothetical protein